MREDKSQLKPPKSTGKLYPLTRNRVLRIKRGLKLQSVLSAVPEGKP
jgi:hypothetical protein